MDRTTRRVFIGILGLLVLAGVALTLLDSGQVPGQPDGPTADGVVIKVDATGLTSVAGFSLRTDDGQILAFDLANLRNGMAFPPGHLAEHLATSQRIRVWYATSATGGLDALWLEDAPVR